MTEKESLLRAIDNELNILSGNDMQNQTFPLPVVNLADKYKLSNLITDYIPIYRRDYESEENKGNTEIFLILALYKSTLVDTATTIEEGNEALRAAILESVCISTLPLMYLGNEEKVVLLPRTEVEIPAYIIEGVKDKFNITISTINSSTLGLISGVTTAFYNNEPYIADLSQIPNFSGTVDLVAEFKDILWSIHYFMNVIIISATLSNGDTYLLVGQTYD